MVTVVKPAQAGTLESSDVMVMVAPAGMGTGADIAVESIVQKQFGPRIIAVVQNFLRQAGITDVKVVIKDRGALDCVIKARLQAALARAGKTER